VGLGLFVALALATAFSTSPAAAAAEAALRIEPATVAAALGSTFSVKVVQEPSVATSGVQASIQFDPTILQVVSVSRGAAYERAPIFLPKDLDADVRNANSTGRLRQVAAAFTPPDAVSPGPAIFLVLRFRAVACGQTDLALPAGGPFNAQMISGQTGLYGHELPVVTSSGHVATCVGPDAAAAGVTDPARAGGPGLLGPIALVGGVGALVAGLLGGLAWRSRRRPRPSGDDEW
jgi:hypothetical protein